MVIKNMRSYSFEMKMKPDGLPNNMMMMYNIQKERSTVETITTSNSYY